jgi:ribulose bisphosphate carboxylase small subunit
MGLDEQATVAAAPRNVYVQVVGFRTASRGTVGQAVVQRQAGGQNRRYKCKGSISTSRFEGLKSATRPGALLNAIRTYRLLDRFLLCS